jgi:Rod binding domain-containing protein
VEINNVVPSAIAKNKSTDYIPKEFKEVASSMEKQFIEHMLEQMEKTTGQKEESTANNYYKGLQRTERSEIISNLSAEGSLKELILDQIYPQKFRNETSYNAYQKMQSSKPGHIK